MRLAGWVIGACVFVLACEPPAGDESAARDGAAGAGAPPTQSGFGAPATAGSRTETPPRRITLGRFEGYGNPATGELWSRLVDDAAPRPVPDGVAVNRQALSAATPGYCEGTIEADGVP